MLHLHHLWADKWNIYIINKTPVPVFLPINPTNALTYVNAAPHIVTFVHVSALKGPSPGSDEYISWAESTKYVSRCKYQIKELRFVC
jgi:hypothetical protein